MGGTMRQGRQSERLPDTTPRRRAAFCRPLPPVAALSLPPRLHLDDDPVVVHRRALLVEYRVFELQLQVVAREEVLRRAGVARDPVRPHAVVRVELLHAADELEPPRYHAVGAE